MDFWIKLLKNKNCFHEVMTGETSIISSGNEWIRAQPFTSLKADLLHDINRDFAFIRCLNNETFPWWKCSVKALVNGVIPSRKCSIQAPAEWRRNSVYGLMEICHQRSKWLHPMSGIKFVLFYFKKQQIIASASFSSLRTHSC